MNPNHWVRYAACKGKPLVIFFPDYRIMNDSRYCQARAICDVCPVKNSCLDMAIVYEDTDDKWGMFGGLTPAERSRLRKKLKEMVR